MKTPYEIYTHVYKAYRKRHAACPASVLRELEDTLEKLADSLNHNERASSEALSARIKQLYKEHLERPWWWRSSRFLVTLIIAFFLAMGLRQTVVDHMEVPTGSMRPTILEGDHMLVSKYVYGFNYFWGPGHVYFDADNAFYQQISVFTVENLPIPDAKQNFFGLLPGYKRYVKRLMGKPGDTLFFYGGRIYGMDRNGKDISPLLAEAPTDHIPFIRFEGVKTQKNGTFEYAQFGQGIGRAGNGQEPTFFNGKTWKKEGLTSALSSYKSPDFSYTPSSYFDLFGMANYALFDMTTENGATTLRLFHHANLNTLTSSKSRFDGFSTSYLPLTEAHVRTLLGSLYTARFVVQNQKAYNYPLNPEVVKAGVFVPAPKVADGTYEFIDGKAYCVGTLSNRTELAKDHPIYSDTLRKALVNSGMDFLPGYVAPKRYAYFRDGELWAMGKKLMKSDDPTLLAFVEKEKQGSSPFIDTGAPYRDGKLDTKLLENFGLKIPEKMYLMLGDNHAGSGDSREFGFVPEDNLAGSPWINIWPTQHLGRMNQPTHTLQWHEWVVLIVCLGALLGWNIHWKHKVHFERAKP